MDKNDILDYVTETPGNTNRAVLGSMLDSFAGGGGGSSDIFIVNESFDGTTYTLDKTFGDIRTALNNGPIVIIRSVTSADPDDYSEDLYRIWRLMWYDDGGSMLYRLVASDMSTQWDTDNIDGYPTRQ